MRYEVMIKVTEIHYHTVEAASKEEAEDRMASLTESDFNHPHVSGSVEYEAKKLPPTLRELSDAINTSGQGCFEVE